jgi:hypothetical protein
MREHPLLQNGEPGLWIALLLGLGLGLGLVGCCFNFSLSVSGHFPLSILRLVSHRG